MIHLRITSLVPSTTMFLLVFRTWLTSTAFSLNAATICFLSVVEERPLSTNSRTVPDWDLKCSWRTVVMGLWSSLILILVFRPLFVYLRKVWQLDWALTAFIKRFLHSSIWLQLLVSSYILTVNVSKWFLIWRMEFFTYILTIGHTSTKTKYVSTMKSPNT